VTDIFQEVEEEVRRERYQQLWKQYGDYILAAAALIVLGVAAWQLWSRYQYNQRVEASNNYIVALETQDPAKAATAFAKLAQTAPDGYALLSRLQEANALQAAGRTQQAAALYRDLMKENDPLFASVARIRLAWAQADNMSKKDMQTLLAPISNPADPFHYMANELLAYMDYREGNVAAAQKEFEQLAAEKDASQGIRERAGVMAAFLAAGGNRNVGTVPPPPARPAQPTAERAAPAPSPEPAKKP
jgi:hypothetical protein